VTETRIHLQAVPASAQLRSRWLPDWYVPMLLDRARNDGYRRALGDAAALSRPPQTVLDIGSGCGLLSMMAARAGAHRVVGCEISPTLHEVAREIVAHNGLADKITLINKDCRALRVPDDLPETADLLVFELFDCSLIGEGVLHFLAHAREHLLKATARFIPMSAVIRGMVIEYRLQRAWDIDLNLLNPYRFFPSFVNVDASRLSYRPLTRPVDIFCFDFANAAPTPAERELRIPAIADGIAGALLFWFDLELAPGLRLTNEPGSHGGLHWKQGLQFLPEARVTGGSVLPVTAKHNGSQLQFGWQPEGLAKETYSSLPRFDARWWRRAEELEHITRGLMQHCRQQPSEYTKVADLAQRFAIDPAAHGIDPVVAQRFAAMFFGA
jgi:type III protein arginine methyltransferase